MFSERKVYIRHTERHIYDVIVQLSCCTVVGSNINPCIQECTDLYDNYRTNPDANKPFLHHRLLPVRNAKNGKKWNLTFSIFKK